MKAGMRPPARSPALGRGEAGLAQATRGHFAFADASEDKWAPSSPGTCSSVQEMDGTEPLGEQTLSWCIMMEQS